MRTLRKDVIEEERAEGEHAVSNGVSFKISHVKLQMHLHHYT